MTDVIRIPPSPALRQWSSKHGFSPELVARWGAFYPDLPGLLHAMQQPPTTYLRLNPLRGDSQETIRRLTEKGFELEASPVPLTHLVRSQPFSIGATEEYLLGRYFLQDLSSSLAPLALEPQQGELIGDLCAAPGGKTIELAGLTQDRAALLAFDNDPERARALTSNLDRCGVTSAGVYATSALEAERLGMAFDRILLDAPCSGEGVVQRDPNRRKGQLGEYAACAAQQAELLALAHRLLRPGGLLVYATCTLAPEENEFQIHAAMEQHGFQLERLPAFLRDLRLAGRPLHPGLTRVEDHEFHASLKEAAHVLPHLHGCLGFFLARLRKEVT